MARRLARIAALSTVLLPSIAASLGVGSIQTESALNEPLEARILLESADAEELETLSATLASPDAFERAGLERPFMLSRLEFDVVTDGAEPYVMVRTSDPVREPFLAFLVELNWDGGRLVREYTLLLDPPVHSPGDDAAPAPAEGPSPDEPAADAPATASPGDPGEPDAVAETPADIEVQQDDTLWEIADDARQDDVSVHQMMMALLAANPDAFINNNVNNVRAGAILRVPDRDEVQVLSAPEARREFAAQVEAWQAGRAPDPTPPDVADEAADEVSEPDVQDGRLEVVAAGDTAGDDATASLMDDDVEASPETVARLQAELSAMREDEASLRSENERLRAQTEELLQRVEALERTLDVQVEGAIPGMPQEPAQDEVPLADTAAEEDPVPGDEEPVAEAVATDDSIADTEEDDPAVAGADEPGATQPQAPWEDPRTLSLAGAATVALLLLGLLIARRRRNAATDASDEVEASFAAAMAAGAATDQETAATESPADPLGDAEAEPRPMVDDELEAPTVPSGKADPLEEAEIYLAYGRYDQARDRLLTAVGEDPERKDLRLKLLETHSLNGDRPAFEADAQALYGIVDGKDDPVWQRASEMGREIAPENPLFGGAEESPVPSSEPDDADDDAFANTLGNELEPAPLADAADTAETPVEPTAPVGAEGDTEDEDDFSDLEFNLEEAPGSRTDEPTGTAANGAEPEADSASTGQDDDALTLDFDLDDLDRPESGGDTPSAAGVVGDTVAEGEADDDEFRLDFEAPERPAPSADAAVSTDTPADENDDDELTFSLDELDTGSEEDDVEEGLEYEPTGDVATDSEADSDSRAENASAAGGDTPVDTDEALFDTGDETSTKLDLARAYLDMGDSEGARSLLDEVLEEGSEAQKSEARTLYADAE